MVDWIKEDGTLAEDFAKNLPEDVRDYAKDAKDIVSLIKRGADTQREFHTRVKLPTDEAGKEKFIKDHFADYMKAREAELKDSFNVQSEEAKAKAQQQKAEQLEQSKARVKDILGAGAETKLELCRRAFRGEHCPPWIREGIAAAAGVEYDKLTDEQFKEQALTDPGVIQTLLTIGDLTKDGRLEPGSHSKRSDIEEKKPIQPTAPELYKNAPADSPERLWFENRGYDFERGEWTQGPPR